MQTIMDKLDSVIYSLPPGTTRSMLETAWVLLACGHVTQAIEMVRRANKFAIGGTNV